MSRGSCREAAPARWSAEYDAETARIAVPLRANFGEAAARWTCQQWAKTKGVEVRLVEGQNVRCRYDAATGASAWESDPPLVLATFAPAGLAAVRRCAACGADAGWEVARCLACEPPAERPAFPRLSLDPRTRPENLTGNPARTTTNRARARVARGLA